MTTPPETIADAQDAVDRWINQWEEGYFSPLSNLARLTEEVGELARLINERHGDKPPSGDAVSSTIEEELGDILFVVITLANSLDVDLGRALQGVLEKYDLRDAHRFTRRS